MRSILLAVIVTIVCFTQAYSVEGNQRAVSCKGDSRRVDITPDQIHFTKGGMFVYINHGFVPVQAIYADDAGRLFFFFPDFMDLTDSMTSCNACGEVYSREQYSRCPNS